MENNVNNQANKSPEEVLRGIYENVSKGTLKLKVPIRNEGVDVEELDYDFTQLTANEYVDAMDSDPTATNVAVTTHKQALALFAAAAEKLCRTKYNLDAKDIKQRMNIVDARKAVQTTQVFLNLCNREL